MTAVLDNSGTGFVDYTDPNAIPDIADPTKKTTPTLAKDLRQDNPASLNRRSGHPKVLPSNIWGKNGWYMNGPHLDPFNHAQSQANIVQSYVQSFTTQGREHVLGNFETMLQKYGHTNTPGTLLALAEMNLPDNHEVSQKILNADATNKAHADAMTSPRAADALPLVGQEYTSFWDRIWPDNMWKVPQAISRNTFAALNAPLQLIQGQQRTVGGEILSKPEESLLDKAANVTKALVVPFVNYEQTDFGQTLKNAWNGGGWDAFWGAQAGLDTERAKQLLLKDPQKAALAQEPGGMDKLNEEATALAKANGWYGQEGWFIDETSRIGEATYQSAFNAWAVPGPDKKLQAWTLGRGIVGATLGPDSSAYNVASGLIDGIAAVAQDPLTYVDGVGLFAKAAKGVGIAAEALSKGKVARESFVVGKEAARAIAKEGNINRQILKAQEIMGVTPDELAQQSIQDTLKMVQDAMKASATSEALSKAELQGQEVASQFADYVRAVTTEGKIGGILGSEVSGGGALGGETQRALALWDEFMARAYEQGPNGPAVDAAGNYILNNAGQYDFFNELRNNPDDWRLFNELRDVGDQLMNAGAIPEADNLFYPAVRQWVLANTEKTLPRPLETAPDAVAAEGARLLSDPVTSDLSALSSYDYLGARMTTTPTTTMPALGLVGNEESLLTWAGKADPVMKLASDVIDEPTKNGVRTTLQQLLVDPAFDVIRAEVPADATSLSSQIARSVNEITDIRGGMNAVLDDPASTFGALLATARKFGLDGVLDDMLRQQGIDGINGIGIAGREISWMGEHPQVVSYALPQTVKDAALTAAGAADPAAALAATAIPVDGIVMNGMRGLSPAELELLAAERAGVASSKSMSLSNLQQSAKMNAEVAQTGLNARLGSIDAQFANGPDAARASLGWEMGLRSSGNVSMTVDEKAVRRVLFGNGPWSHFANKTLQLLGSFVPKADMETAMKAGAGSKEYTEVFSKAAGSLALFTKGKWDTEVYAALARNAIEGGGKEGVIRILTPRLGVDVTRGSISRTMSAISTDGKSYFRSWRRPSSVIARALGRMPASMKVDITNPNQIIDTIMMYGMYARLPEEQIAKRIGRIIEASGTNRVIGTNRRQLARTFDDISEKLLKDIDANKFAGVLYKGTAGQARLDEIKQAIQSSTRLWGGGETGVDLSFRQAMAANGAPPHMMTGDGVSMQMPDISIDTEIANGFVHLPSVDQWSDALSRFSLVVSRNKTIRNTADLARRFFDNFFRTTMLVMRLAFIARNLGEMDVRMFLNGHKSIYTDPLSMIGMTVGNITDSRIAAKTARIAKDIEEELPPSLVGQARIDEVARLTKQRTEGFLPAFQTTISPYSETVLGTKFEAGIDEQLAVANHVDDYQALTRFAHSLTDPRVYNSAIRQNFQPIAWGSPNFFDGWAHELIMLERSEIARLVVDGPPGSSLGSISSNMDAKMDSAVNWLLGDHKDAVRVRELLIGADEKFAPIFSDFAATREYLFTNPNSVYNRVLSFTNNDPKLLEYIGTGKFGEFNPRTLLKPGDRISQFSSLLKREYNNDAWRDHFTGNNVMVPWVDKLDKTDGIAIFNWFFDKSNKIERLGAIGPEYRMAYWDKIAELAPTLNADEVPRALRAARTTLGPLKRLRDDGKVDAFGRNHPAFNALSRQGKSGNNGMMTLDELHAIANEYAAEEVSKLFYDAARRNNLWYQMRLLFPFGQAWGNTMKTWATLAAKNPIQVYKAQKFFNAMTESGSSSIYQFGQQIGAYGQYAPGQAPWDQTANGGFFYTDANGDTSFVYPYLGRAAAAFVNGVNMISGRGNPGIQDMAVQSPLSSLNPAMAGDQVLPGVHPMLAAPLATGILPDSEIVDSLRQIVAPYGDKNAAESYIPAWLSKILAGAGSIPGIGAVAGDQLDFLAPGNKDKYVRDAMLILTSGGKYDLTDPVSAQQLRDDAKGLAKSMLLTTGLIQNFLPSTPMPQTSAVIPDFDGSKTTENTALYTVGVMNSMFQQYRQRNGYDDTAAREEWVKDFGPAALFATTGDWKNLSRIPTSQALQWARKQDFKDVARANIDQFTLFFPRGDSSDVLATDWIAKYGKGDRVRKNAQDMYDEILQMLESVQKLRIQSMEANGLINSAEAEAARDDIKQRYQEVSKTSGTYVDKTAAIEKIHVFYENNAVMAGTPAAPAFEQAWALRTAALSKVREQTGSNNAGLGSNRAAPVRAWYNARIDELVQQYPDFVLLASQFKKEWD